MDKQQWFDSGLYREFQATIRAWKGRTGLSDMAIGHLCGFSQSAVSRWLASDYDYLVQPQRKLLAKLSGKIGIDLPELERQAGLNEDAVVGAEAEPRELTMLVHDIKAGWWAAPEHERPIRAEVARAALPHIPKRPNRRIRGKNAGLDGPNDDYRMHKLVA